ncbi:expressed unknown protein [Seminavis robusta]|uniref:Uncharacterized protein n=1 Tax=Seminavis robusta TaxID=568900 RepID=A0A9N8H406_9STRA|nr:expressed unknown protein [Seminavis robusta]|eukprot:Sro3_g002030.1 n/a (453) ;mRNA; r:25907-27265
MLRFSVSFLLSLCGVALLAEAWSPAALTKISTSSSSTINRRTGVSLFALRRTLGRSEDEFFSHSSRRLSPMTADNRLDEFELERPRPVRVRRQDPYWPEPEHEHEPHYQHQHQQHHQDLYHSRYNDHHAHQHYPVLVDEHEHEHEHEHDDFYHQPRDYYAPYADQDQDDALEYRYSYERSEYDRDHHGRHYEKGYQYEDDQDYYQHTYLSHVRQEDYGTTQRSITTQEHHDVHSGAIVPVHQQLPHQMQQARPGPGPDANFRTMVLQDEQVDINAIYDDAELLLEQDPACADILGLPLRLDHPFSKSSATTSINGDTQSRTELQLHVDGQWNSGLVQLVATNEGILNMVLLIDEEGPQGGYHRINVNLDVTTALPPPIEGGPDQNIIMEAEILDDGAINTPLISGVEDRTDNIPFPVTGPPRVPPAVRKRPPADVVPAIMDEPRPPPRQEIV